MKRLSRKQKFWAMLGAGLLAAAVSGSALARHIADRDALHLEVRQEKKSTTSASPLPAPENDAEFTGVVEVMASNMWVVGGRTVAVTAATEIKPGLEVGTLAKVHAVRQADGSLWVRAVEPAGDNGNANSNDDNGNNNDNDDGNVNSNDDNRNNNDIDDGNVNSNDVGNDDHGGNGNLNSNDENGDDDHGSNGNDHNGNDDHGSNGNGG